MDCKDNETIMTPDDAADLFCHLAHGTAEHRIWLKRAIERFFNYCIPEQGPVIEALKEPEGRHAI